MGATTSRITQMLLAVTFFVTLASTVDFSTAAGQENIFWPYKGNVRVLQGCHNFTYGTQCAIDVTGNKKTLVMPFDGSVEANYSDGWFYNSGKGIYEPNTILKLRSSDHRFCMWIVHGDYTVQAGQNLALGEVIGTEASNGHSSQPHSHIELYLCKGGRREGINPMQYLQVMNAKNRVVEGQVTEADRIEFGVSTLETGHADGVFYTPQSQAPADPAVPAQQSGGLSSLPFIVDQRQAITNQVFPHLADCHDRGPIQHIVWHQIAVKNLTDPENMDGIRLASAFKNARKWDKPGYSILIGWNQHESGYAVTYQMTNTDCFTYGVGPGINGNAIHLAFVDFPFEAGPTEIQLKSMLAVTQALLTENGLSPEVIIGHKEFTGENNPDGHTDPHGVKMAKVRAQLTSGITPAIESQAPLVPIEFVAFAEPLPTFGRLDNLEEKGNRMVNQAGRELSRMPTITVKNGSFPVLAGFFLFLMILGWMAAATDRQHRMTYLLSAFACVVLAVTIFLISLPSNYERGGGKSNSYKIAPPAMAFETSTPPPSSQANGNCIPNGPSCTGQLLPYDQLMAITEPGHLQTCKPRLTKEKYDAIVSQSLAAGYHPAFTLAHWIEETACGTASDKDFGVVYIDGVEFQPTGSEDENFRVQLEAFLGKAAYYETESQFAQCRQAQPNILRHFMLLYAYGTTGCAANSFEFTPNYPVNLPKFYSLVTGGGQIDFGQKEE